MGETKTQSNDFLFVPLMKKFLKIQFGQCLNCGASCEKVIAYAVGEFGERLQNSECEVGYRCVAGCRLPIDIERVKKWKKGEVMPAADAGKQAELSGIL